MISTIATCTIVAILAYHIIEIRLHQTRSARLGATAGKYTRTCRIIVAQAGNPNAWQMGCPKNIANAPTNNPKPAIKQSGWSKSTGSAAVISLSVRLVISLHVLSVCFSLSLSRVCLSVSESRVRAFPPPPTPPASDPAARWTPSMLKVTVPFAVSSHKYLTRSEAGPQRLRVCSSTHCRTEYSS